MLLYTLMALSCSVFYAFSAILCKYGLQYKLDVRSLSLRKLIVFLAQNKIWLIGVAISGVANIAMIEIQSKLDLSIVYSLMNLSYIFVLVLGHYLLHEHLTRKQWLGVGIVTAGTVLIMFISDPSTGQPTNLTNLLVQTAVAVSLTVVLITIGYFNSRKNYEVIFAVCAGICFGCVETYLKANTNLVTSELGNFSILETESILKFLSVWPFFVMFAFGALGWVCLQITYSHGNVSVTIPVIAVTQRIVSMSSGYFVFDEYFDLLRIFGVSSIILGVFILIISTLKINNPKPV